MKLVQFALLSFLLATPRIGLATVYYVDYAAGNDSNNGLSTSSPFKHSPGDPQATGTVPSVSLQPGDVVEFKGGVDYLGQVLVNASGTSDAYITYRGSAAWGVGKPIFEMQMTREYGFKSTSARHYIRIEGIEFFHYKDGSDHVLQLDSGSTYWKIDNCAFGYMETWAQDAKHPVVLLTGGHSYIYFTNNEFFKSGHYTLRLQNSDHIYIQNNDFGGINRSAEDTGWISVAVLLIDNPTYTYIQDNVFHDYWKSGGDQNPELAHSPDLIHTYAIGGGVGPEHIYIERNYFYNDHQFSTGSGTGDMSISTNSSYVYIRNNLFVNSAQWWGATVWVTHGADNVWIENNTFIMRDYLNPSAVYGLKLGTGGGYETGPNIYVYNNIFYNDDTKVGSTCIEFVGGGTFLGESDYNTFYSINGDGYAIGSNGLKTLAQWQATGNDLHSTYDTDGSSIFVNFPSDPENSSSGNYRLNPAVALDQIDKGTPRSGYSDSFDGTPRPQGAGWDIGAYEYLDGPPTNNPPSVSATATSPVIQPGPSTLDGTSSDDGLPDPPAALTFSWSQVSGPGTATFANSNAEDTTATFSAPGTYQLRLTASDSELQDTADVSVLVYPTGTVNQPPQVSATTPTPTVSEPGPATLDGTVSDDGLPNPPGAFTTVWSKTSGPGTVTFADASAVDTTATFSAPGSYVLRLTANDSQATAFAEVGITVITPPPAVDIRVAAGSDDAEERPTGGGVYVTSSDLEMVDDGGNIQTVAMRFTGVAIPPGATIVEAWIQFQVDETDSQATSLTIQGQDSDDAAGFTTDVGSISTRPRTAASVPWSPPAWNQIGAAGADQRTPSFPAVIQEIVDRPGWSSGNALVVIVTGSGKRVAESYEGDPGGAPLLHVGFDPGSAIDWIFTDDFESGDTTIWSSRYPQPPN